MCDVRRVLSLFYTCSIGELVHLSKQVRVGAFEQASARERHDVCTMKRVCRRESERAREQESERARERESKRAREQESERARE